MSEPLVCFFIGVLFSLTIVILITLARVCMSVRRIESQVNAIVTQSGIDPLAIAVDEATRMAREGKKIEAIKSYRILTGCGLAEAKMKVEAMM